MLHLQKHRPKPPPMLQVQQIGRMVIPTTGGNGAALIRNRVH